MTAKRPFAATPDRDARCGRAAIVAVVLMLSTSCGVSAGEVRGAIAARSTAPIGVGLKSRADLQATVFAEGIDHAAAFAFDDDGGLWVGTAGYDADGTDGVYYVAAAGAEPVQFITDVSTVLGLVWNDDELYVASAGRVDAFGGFDGESFTEHRTVLTIADIGEVNGLAVSPGGRLVLGISAPCDACDPVDERSGAVLSFLPDGSDVRVEASGIRAPIGLAYFPGTDDLFVTMNQRDDLGDATPGDWLAVVERGQDWGFPECYGQDDAACDGVPDPVAELEPHAAVSGVAIVTGELGDTVGTAAVVAEWMLGKVQLVPLRTGAGGTEPGDAEDFITGIANPVAVALGPDGALYVSDWSIGAVYRVAAA
jgi:glucose/arabinose dehydrogenase